jgi:hypothetical protein
MAVLVHLTVENFKYNSVDDNQSISSYKFELLYNSRLFTNHQRLDLASAVIEHRDHFQANICGHKLVQVVSSWSRSAVCWKR